MAARMRSILSRTEVSARPDMWSMVPRVMLTSMVTVVASRPLTAAQNVFTSMIILVLLLAEQLVHLVFQVGCTQVTTYDVS